MSERILRNLAHFTSVLGEKYSGQVPIYRVFKVYHPMLEAQTDITVREASESYHVFEKFMDLLVCGAENERSSTPRIKSKEQLLALMGINYEGYETASLFFEDLVRDGHFRVTPEGIVPLECAALSIDNVDIERLSKELLGEEVPEDSQENVKLEYKYTEKNIYEKKLFDQYSLEPCPKEFYGLEGFLALTPEGRDRNIDANALWLPPDAKLLGGTAALAESLNNLKQSSVSYVERGLPSGMYDITLAANSEPELIFCPYYLAVFKDAEGNFSFAAYEPLHGNEIKWMSDNYNNCRLENDPYYNTVATIVSICQREENSSVFSPIFAQWPLKINGVIATEYGYSLAENGNYRWTMQPYQFRELLELCKYEDQRIWIKFALNSTMAVLDSFEAGRLVAINIKEEYKTALLEALQQNPEKAGLDEYDRALLKAKELFLYDQNAAKASLEALENKGGEAYYLLGRIELNSDPQKAYEFLKNSLELGYAPASYYLFLAALSKGKLTATELLELLKESYKAEFSLTILLLGYVLNKMGHTDQAETYFGMAREMGVDFDEEALEENPYIAPFKNLKEDTPEPPAATPVKVKENPQSKPQDDFEDDSEYYYDDEEEKPEENLATPPVFTFEAVKPRVEEVDEDCFYAEHVEKLDVSAFREYYLKTQNCKPFTEKDFLIMQKDIPSGFGYMITGRKQPWDYTIKTFVRGLYNYGDSSVALDYKKFIEFSYTACAEALSGALNAEDIFFNSPNPIEILYPNFKNEPKITDLRVNNSYRFLADTLADPRYTDLKKRYLTPTRGYTNGNEQMKGIISDAKAVAEHSLPCALLLSACYSRRSYLSKQLGVKMEDYKDLFLSNGLTVFHLADVEKAIKDKDPTTALAILNFVDIGGPNGFSHYLRAKIKLKSKDKKGYYKELLMAREEGYFSAFDSYDSASYYENFDETYSLYNGYLVYEGLEEEERDVNDALLRVDTDENASLRSYSYLSRLESYLNALSINVLDSLIALDFIPALYSRGGIQNLCRAAILGGMGSLTCVAEELLKKGCFKQAEECLILAASKGCRKAADRLIEYYIREDVARYPEACNILGRLADWDKKYLVAYMVLFDFGTDPNCKTLRDFYSTASPDTKKISLGPNKMAYYA